MLFRSDLTIVWLAAVVPYGVVALALEAAGAPALQLPGFTAAQTVDAVMGACAVVAFVLVEVVIPWTHDGSTPGGSFVRMTFETHPRTTGYRAVFYLARMATLIAALFVWPWLILLLLLFYLIKREMPYDLIP